MRIFASLLIEPSRFPTLFWNRYRKTIKLCVSSIPRRGHTVVMVEFRYWLLQLPFEVQAAVQFPPSFSANVFRGALGTRLPRNLFSPARAQPGPSGFVEPPRPFVLRARHLDGLSLSPGDTFYVCLHLFGRFGAQIEQAFREAQPFHGAVRLAGTASETEVVLPLLPTEPEPGQAHIHFLTPTELKHNDTLAALPHFPILFARASARLRTLASFYGEPIEFDFEKLSVQSEQVEMIEHSLKHEWGERFSTRTGQTHPLGGFTGSAKYEGQLRELLPLIRAAQYTGVGRQTVWGKGEIEVAWFKPAVLSAQLSSPSHPNTEPVLPDNSARPY